MTEIEIEKDIADHIKAKRPIAAIAAYYISKILDPDTSFEERRARLRFLHLAGLKAEVLRTYAQALKAKLEMPLSYLAETLVQAKLKPPREVLEELFEPGLSSEQERDVASSKAWRAWDKNAGKYTERLYRHLRGESGNRREQMRDRLIFYQNQRMVDDERRLLQLSLKMFPQDPDFMKAEAEFAERWARHVIAQATLNQLDVVEHKPLTAALSGDQWPAAAALLEESIRLVEADPRDASDLTVMFWFLELYPQALIILDKGENTPAQRWFRVEILLKLRRFVDALTELQELELEFSNNPEAAFAGTYFRAQALHGLGQSSQALEMMQSLVHVRPEYRSAKTFVAKWNEGRGGGGG